MLSSGRGKGCHFLLWLCAACPVSCHWAKKPSQSFRWQQMKPWSLVDATVCSSCMIKRFLGGLGKCSSYLTHQPFNLRVIYAPVLPKGKLGLERSLLLTPVPERQQVEEPGLTLGPFIQWAIKGNITSWSHLLVIRIYRLRGLLVGSKNCLPTGLENKCVNTHALHNSWETLSKYLWNNRARKFSGKWELFWITQGN